MKSLKPKIVIPNGLRAKSSFKTAYRKSPH